MWQISTKFVPCLLTDEQNQRHIFVCQEMLDEFRKDKNFLLGFITGDET
jgi:hypothetical protein